MKTLFILLFLTNILFSQNRNIRPGLDIIWHNHNYNVVEIGSPDIYGNIEWKEWLKQNIVLTDEVKNILPKKTQLDNQIGIMINPISDSMYFNPEGAMNVCPIGFRLPRIGEFDTLIKNLTINERAWFFGDLSGYIEHINVNVNDSIKLTKNYIKGGFWWTSTIIYNDEEKYKYTGIELDYMYNYHIGYGDLGDYAAVRCVRNKNDDE